MGFKDILNKGYENLAQIRLPNKRQLIADIMFTLVSILVAIKALAEQGVVWKICGIAIIVMAVVLFFMPE